VIRGLLAAMLLLPAIGCLPDIGNPGCATDRDCLDLGDGWCRCSLWQGQGICLKAGCSGSATVDDVGPEVQDSPDIAVDVAEIDPCADAVVGAQDECCPTTLAARHTDPDCAVLSVEDALEALALPPTLNASGELLVVHSAPLGTARLSLFGASLQPLGGNHEMGVPLAEVRGPVALKDGRFVMATGAQLVFFGAAMSAPQATPLAGGALPASAPIPLDSGAVLVVAVDGSVIAMDGTSDTPLGQLDVTGERAEVGLDADERFLHVVSAGQLHGFDLQKGEASPAWPGTWSGAPAVSGDAVYAVLSPDSIGGARREGGQWTALVPSASVGAAPHPPVVGRGEVTYVAASQEKRLTAIRWVTGAPSVSWTLDQLADVPASAPLVGEDDIVYVPLSNGRLTAVSGSGVILWHFDLGGQPAGDPLFWGDDSTLMASGGRLARIRSLGPHSDHPWARRRHDAASTGHGE
jgi:hypothetical protein